MHILVLAVVIKECEKEMGVEFKSKRKQDILLYAVDEYIKKPQPITSAGLSVKFSDVSTATLRNELNALEQMGYLQQLHT